MSGVRTAMFCIALRAAFPWVTATPRGMPVEPDVYCTTQNLVRRRHNNVVTARSLGREVVGHDLFQRTIQFGQDTADPRRKVRRREDHCRLGIIISAAMMRLAPDRRAGTNGTAIAPA